MSVYTLEGRHLDTVEIALPSFERFLDQSAFTLDRVGVSLNSDLAEPLLDSVRDTELERLSVFGWGAFRLREFAGSPELSQLVGCSISNGEWHVEVGEQSDLPHQDWGEKPPLNATIRLAHTVRKSSPSELGEVGPLGGARQAIGSVSSRQFRRLVPVRWRRAVPSTGEKRRPVSPRRLPDPYEESRVLSGPRS